MTDGNIDGFDPNDEKDTCFLEAFKQIILKSIETVGLDLSNKVVLTEAATGNWISTPIIAALSDSRKVLCFTRDSQYGNSRDIKNNFQRISKYLEIENITVFSDKTSPLISEADIITNSGLLRPLDKNFLNLVSSRSVISLMWEPWEFRDSEIDLEECWNRQIPILGVNERHSDMDIMKYDAEAIIAIISKNKISIKNKNIIIVGENPSSLYMYSKLTLLNANVFFITKLLLEECKERKIPVIGSAITEENSRSYLENCDILVINSIPVHTPIIGDGGISAEELKKLQPDISIFVYFGVVDYKQISLADLRCFPTIGKNNGYMSWTVDILGPQPTIELNTLGLKVGQILADNKTFSKLETEKLALQSDFCLDFSQEQKEKYYQVE